MDVRPRVLIADADELLLAACRAFLAAEGFDTATAASAPDCLDALRRDPPDLLLVDSELPQGSRVLARVREDPDLPAVPVLILTGQPAPLIEMGPPARCALMIKPISPSAVAQLVRSLGEWDSVEENSPA